MAFLYSSHGECLSPFSDDKNPYLFMQITQKIEFSEREKDAKRLNCAGMILLLSAAFA